jgi:hypothetical protein
VPFLRQQAGRFASVSEATSGAISVQLNSIVSESAITRRIVKDHSIYE